LFRNAPLLNDTLQIIKALAMKLFGPSGII